MKKVNNGGFLLSESLIVSTFVLTVITLMFVQFKGIIVNNKKQYTYNNVEDIYSLGSLAEFFTNSDVVVSGSGKIIQIYKDGNCTSNVASASRGTCTAIASAMGAEYIYYADSNIDNLKNDVASSTLNQDIKDFVERLNADKVEGRKRLIAKFLNGDFATVVIPDKMPVYTDLTCSEVVYIGNSACNEPCGGGTMTQYAYDKNDNSIRCLEKDKKNVSCNTQACPTTFTGTVYRWSYTDWSYNQDISNFKAGVDYVTDEKKVTTMSSLAANYYLKHTVVNNIVTESYVCFKADSWKCLLGGNSSYYALNNSTLQGLNSWFVNNGGYCTFNSLHSQCRGGVFDFVEAAPDGYVSVDEDDMVYCVVHSSGNSYNSGKSFCSG